MQITYFPYLNLENRDEISFGDIKIWNFDKKCQDYIKDKELRNKVGLLIKSNVRYDRPIENIGVISIGSTDFREFRPDEQLIVNEVRLLLFLSYFSAINISSHGPNAGHYVATSENFTFAIQNFDPNSDGIAQQNGFIVKMLNGVGLLVT